MNLASQIIVDKQLMMPSSNSAPRNLDGAGDGNISDQFPAGLRVLVVDDDRICLVILDKMLRKCNYQVTRCSRAEVALSLLRENKNGFDVVISDVHMPDMDGFKLLVHIGLEMDLPVIMMSADDSKSVVMNGVTHGACDYLIKPVRIEALRNIWQHVVRKRKHGWKDLEPSATLDDGDRQQIQKQPEDPDYSSSANEGQNGKNTKRRKDDEDEAEERDDSSSSKKPRVVWSQELHQQFVAAVNQLGFDKAVPKKILDLMNVPGLTRENVASHLQKFRIYLKRLGGSHQSGSFMSNLDASYGPISSLSELDFQALAASGQLDQLPAGRPGNSNYPISVHSLDQTNVFSFGNPKPTYGQVQNHHGHNSNNIKPMNLLHGIPTNMVPKDLVGFQHSFTGMNSQAQILIACQSQSQSHVSRQLHLPNPELSQPSSLVGYPVNHRTESNGNSYPLGGNLGISPIMSTSTLQQAQNIETKILREVFVPNYGLSNNVIQNKQHDRGLQGVGLTFNPFQHTHNKVNVLTGTHIADIPLRAKVENANDEPSHQPFCPEEYSQDNLLTAILTQQHQEGIRQPENEFGFSWYSSDNLPV